MHADGGADGRPRSFEPGRLGRLTVVSRLEDDEDAFHARPLRAPHDVVEIGGERLVGEMTM
jgi:hypothetical protein